MDAEQKRRLKRATQDRERTKARQALTLEREDLDNLLDHLDAALGAVTCDHSLRLTMVWADENGVDHDALRTSLESFGGFCDCEVLANIEPEEIFGPDTG